MTASATAPAGRALVVVLDDDPTGTQAACNVPVLLDPEADPTPLLAENDALYILTNSRALDEPDAVSLLVGIRERVDNVARRLGASVEYVLRGDSTLRGHVFAESDVFGAAQGVLLFVPAFPAGGRTTVGGVHHLEIDGRRTPVADTEFARDPVFGYRSRALVDWVAEVGNRTATGLTLSEVREGPLVLAAALRQAAAGTVLVPDAATDDDLRIISAAADLARESGTHLVIRTAATLAALRADRLAPDLLRPPLGQPAGPTLMVCGSHTSSSSGQLAAFARTAGVPIRTLPTAAALADADDAGRRLAGQLSADLAEQGSAIIATERRRRAEHGQLHHGATIMRALCAAVRFITQDVSAVVTKGGITSADVARHGFGARVATVTGPLLPGVPVWRLHLGGGRRLLYVVVPGNVGGDQTLVHVDAALQTRGVQGR